MESSPLHFQVQEPGLSPGGSWNKSRPQSVPVFLPSFVRTFSCLKPAQRARSGLFSLCFSFLLVVPLLMSCRIFELSRVTFQIKSYTLLDKAHINAGKGADWGVAAGMMMCVGAQRDPTLALGGMLFQPQLAVCSPALQNEVPIGAQCSGQMHHS